MIYLAIRLHKCDLHKQPMIYELTGSRMAVFKRLIMNRRLFFCQSQRLFDAFVCVSTWYNPCCQPVWHRMIRDSSLSVNISLIYKS